MNRERKKLILALDFGGSATKIIGGRTAKNRKAMVMSPEIIEMPLDSLRAKTQEFGTIRALKENRAWIGVDGKYLALGHLAQQFNGNARLSLLKSEIAIYKVLAACWLMGTEFKLGSNYDLALTCALPPGEYQDRWKFKELLTKALLNFDTPDGKFQVNLSDFNCKPEGVGVFMSHWQKRGEGVKDAVCALVMLGYRNASIVIIEKGNFGDWQTTDLGFVKMVKKVQQRTAGYSLEALAPAIAQWDGKDDKSLRAIRRKAQPEGKLRELEDLKNNISIAREEYTCALTNWMSEMIPKETDDLVFSGGTADYLEEELTAYCQTLAPIYLYWHGGVEIPSDIESLGLSNRMADVWILWLSFLEKMKKSRSRKKLSA